MSEPGPATVAVSTGDPAGSSPELIPPLVRAVPDHLELVFMGPDSVRERMGLDRSDDRYRWESVGSYSPDRVLAGQPGSESGRCAYQALEAVARECDRGRADGILTLPLSKEAVHESGEEGFRGHTAYLENRWDSRAVMTFLGESLNVALLTRHRPLNGVSGRLNVEFMERQIRTVKVFFKEYEDRDPRVALLGLNPHAGEKGLIGDEERTMFGEVLDRLEEDGVTIEGPFAADSFFPIHADRFDVVIACYHDQGLIPFKMNHFYTGVHASLGLPVPRVSPDHGVAADLAGTGRVDHRSSVNALERLGRWLTPVAGDDGPDG